VQRALILAGGLLLIAGILWPLITKSGFGRLPGDILIERGNTKIYLPVTSSIVASIVISVVVYLFRR